MKRFEGKVAVITGAGRGIGRETALLFAAQGARVLVNDFGGGPRGGDDGDPAIAQSVVDEIKALGGEAVVETSSVTSMAGGKAVIDTAMDAFGRVDFVINNAGIIRPKRITEMTEEDFDLVLNVNLKGYFATIRYAADQLIKNRGAVVSYSSPSGFGHFGMTNYSAAKEGVVGLTRSAARDFGEYGVRCNVIRPVAGGSAMAIPEVFETIRYTVEELQVPYISNQWLDSGGIESRSAHVACVAVWLCSEESAPINGREVYINGAQIALVQEPELIRSRFNPQGWDYESLCKPEVVAALTFDQRNRFLGKT